MRPRHFARTSAELWIEKRCSSPVRLGRDGTFHSYLPRMAYARGLTGPELVLPVSRLRSFCGALPLAEPFVLLDARDPRMVDTLDVMEELGTSVAAVREQEEARKKKGLSTDDAWFWQCYVILPKASHNANIYLLQDDVPSFLPLLDELLRGHRGRGWKVVGGLAFGQL